jgi:hypothetical protein
MLTPWGETLDRERVLQEYPRPQLRRDSYLNLNGTWEYAITEAPGIPDRFDGEILVPFSPESVLSGVGRTLWPGAYLWYRRTVTLPAGFRRGRLLLQFGAVDQIATVYVDGTELFTHVGGFTPFTVDVTDAARSDSFTLLVRVSDTTDSAGMTFGKQRLRHGRIWYPPQSGIWQTVWMESVPENYIRGVRIIPHFDKRQVELWVAGSGTCTAQFAGGTHSFPAGRPARLDVPDMHPWSPEDPFLYDLRLTLGEDAVDSYFAMRKFSVERDSAGDMRLTLNGRPYYQNGVLDQGYWSDGLLTAPSDEALIYDIELAKSMGFNMLRKHMKIEPLRWYYHCDRLGMLVWQDMPAGGTSRNPLIVSLPLFTGIQLRDNRYGLFGRRSAEGRTQFYRELHEMVAALFNCPCVAMWVPFNEGWGQFDSAKVCAGILSMDTSRVIDHASGWHDQGIGFVRSLHVYGRSFRMKDVPSSRAIVLSEFGGYTLRIDGHCRPGRAFGYRRFDSANSYKYALLDLYKHQILPAHSEGLSASVYTQLSDVEDELNGLVTYDRRVVKLSPKLMCGIVKIY